MSKFVLHQTTEKHIIIQTVWIHIEKYCIFYKFLIKGFTVRLAGPDMGWRLYIQSMAQGLLLSLCFQLANVKYKIELNRIAGSIPEIS